MTRTTTDPTGARTGTTTESPAGGPGPVTVARTRRTVSVRTRITATVTALVTLALAGAGLVVYVVESDRIDERVVSESQQELDEYVQSRRLQTSGPADLASDLAEFLADNVPDDDELLVAEVEGGPQRFTPASARADGALADPGVRAAIDELTRTGGSTRLETAQGPVLVNSQVVEGGGERGALLVITFLADARAELRETIGTYAVVSVLSLLLIGGVASWQSGLLLRPLRTVRETAEEITGTDLSRRLPVRGNDDVTALTRTVNDMLDRLEAAHLRQRQLLDDAGHELRTPLTVLSGHLELLDHTDAAEVDQTRDLLLGEVDRMSRLVGDLILLAKTDRPDFLDARPVEVGRLTEVVLAKARVLGPRRWTLDDHAEGPAVLDEQRITQALLQLVDNAVKHTRDGDVVALGSRRVPGAVELWVRDTGPGVPAEDRDRIFERFGRGAVRADDEGFGLGLAIVDAIARAHGGELRLDHTYVDGARFTLRLPGD